MGDSEAETETDPDPGDGVECSALHPLQKVLREVRRKVLITRWNPGLASIHGVQTSADTCAGRGMSFHSRIDRT